MGAQQSSLPFHNFSSCHARADVKNRRGKSKSGRKVTGLAFQPGGKDGGGLLLVTSADARLRLFDGYTLVCKAKGPTLGCAAS